jgi:lysophospholipase L1-like esterase
MRIAFVGDSLTQGIPGCSYLKILRERLPDCRLVNLGVGNDTVISAYRRIRRIAGLHVDEPFDMAFLWVGVNDVAREAKWWVRLANALRRQPRPRDTDEFTSYYGRALDVLCRLSRRVVAVSPSIRGEDIDNRWNRELGTLAGIIEDLAARRGQVSYLDVRASLLQALDGKPMSSYRPKTHQILLDGLTLQKRAQIDRKAAERGLHLTLDGVHLNGAGAELVAERFLEAIPTTAGLSPWQ